MKQPMDGRKKTDISEPVVARQQRLDSWAEVPEGTQVRVLRDDGSYEIRRTQTKPWMMGGHTPMIKLVGISGGYALCRCTIAPPEDQTFRCQLCQEEIPLAKRREDENSELCDPCAKNVGVSAMSFDVEGKKVWIALNEPWYRKEDGTQIIVGGLDKNRRVVMFGSGTHLPVATFLDLYTRGVFVSEIRVEIHTCDGRKSVVVFTKKREIVNMICDSGSLSGLLENMVAGMETK